MAISDRAGRVIHRVRRDVDAFGAVDTEVTLPASAALGIYSVDVTSGDAKATGSFDVQEYRKPEFEVSVTPGVALGRQGQTIDVTVNARYYFGQPVRNAEVRLVVQSGPYYSPLRWVDSESEDEAEGGYFYGGDELDTLTARLDAQGQARFKVPLPESGTEQ